jgi:hypothetical protein
MDIWGLLGDFVDRGLAAQDTIGQLIGRTLSISAMDFAIDALADVCELKYQTPVTVAAYYKAFLTDEAWETLRHSTPANRARLSKNSALKTRLPMPISISPTMERRSMLPRCAMPMHGRIGYAEPQSSVCLMKKSATA